MSLIELLLSNVEYTNGIALSYANIYTDIFCHESSRTIMPMITATCSDIKILE